ncbi:MAG: VOC family protein [Actinomycetota bacterium]|nr:VOC family protein [Actinomycetota bacterium]
MSLSECKISPAAAVSDIERAAEFYEGVLGFEPTESGDDMRVYPCGDGTALFVYVSEHAGTNKATLAGFEVSDFDAMHTGLKQRGVEFERYDDQDGLDTNDEGVFDAGDFKVAFFKDPDGNIFSING